MDPAVQNLVPQQCHEFQLTSNHLHGEENCPECKAFNSKTKKTLKISSQTYEKKAETFEKKAQVLNVKAQTFNYNYEENKVAQNEENAYEYPEEEGDEFEEYEAGVDEDDDLEVGEKNLALYEKYKNCECCQGMIFQCKGSVCKSLEACYCYMRDMAEKSFE
jgi:phage FluMu protein Com